VRIRAHPSRRAELFVLRKIVFASPRAPCADTRANDMRAHDWCEPGPHLVRSRACDLRETKPQSIRWSRAFRNFDETTLGNLRWSWGGQNSIQEKALTIPTPNGYGDDSSASGPLLAAIKMCPSSYLLRAGNDNMWYKSFILFSQAMHLI
jgi:hypothetical protein